MRGIWTFRMLCLNTTLDRNHLCFLWPYWEKNLNLQIWEMGQNLNPALKKFLHESSWEWWLEGLSDGGLKAVTLSPLLHSLSGNFVLMVSVRTALCVSELFARRGLSAGFQQVPEERLVREAGETRVLNLCLNQFTAYSLLRYWEDSPLSVGGSSEVGAGSLSRFPVTQN